MSGVILYTSQHCPFCKQAEHLLTERNVGSLAKIRVDLDPAQLQQMIELTGRRSVPQIFIGERHIGGYDDLAKLDRSGELSTLRGNH